LTAAEPATTPIAFR